MLDRSAVALLAVVSAGCSKEEDQVAALPGVEVPIDAGNNDAASWTMKTLVPEALADGNLALLVDGEGVGHVAFSVRPTVQSELRHGWFSDGEGHSEPVGKGGVLKGWVAGSSEFRLIYGDDSYRTIAWSAVRGLDGLWSVDEHSFSPNGVATTGIWNGERMQMARLTSLPVEGGWLHGVEYDGELIPEAHQLLTLTPVSAELDLAVDSSGRAHIVYAAPVDDVSALGPPGDEGSVESLRYVSVHDGVWTNFYTLTPEPGFYTGVSLVLGAADEVHITYTVLPARLSGRRAVVQHVHRPAQGAWEHDIVPIDNARTARKSLHVDAAGSVHLAYCTVNDELNCVGAAYAARSLGLWTTEIVQTGCNSVGSNATLAAGVDGAIHLAYRACGGVIAFATRSTQ